MGNTAKAPADGGEDLEITELVEFEPDRLDGVKTAATGIGFLMMKSAAKADAAAHAPFTGDHTHPHPAFDGPDGDSDGVHGHQHTHDGDNDHHHEHAEPAGGAGKSASELAAKAVVRGKIDEGPDIDLGKQIMGLLGQAISNEADEIAAGSYGETCDVDLLNCAASMINRWLGKESGPDDGAWDGVVMAAAAIGAEGEIYKRKFTAGQRRKAAAAGHALSDGSYPIENEEDLGAAATLARSGHGNVAAAKRLIARRATELGVANPLDEDGNDDGDGKSSKSTVADGGTDVQTDAQGTGSLSKAVEDAVTKANEPLLKRIADLESVSKAQADELAKVKATPLPGGPVLSNVRPTARAADGDDWAAKAALYRSKADAATTPADREGYRQLAREADDKAAKAITAT